VELQLGSRFFVVCQSFLNTAGNIGQIDLHDTKVAAGLLALPKIEYSPYRSDIPASPHLSVCICLSG
jgi:hypothetical protein